MKEIIEINLDKKELEQIITEHIKSAVKKSVFENRVEIQDSINKFFKTNYIDCTSSFSNQLNKAFDSSFKEALEIAFEELNIKELIKQKTKELLSADSFIKDLAEKKVRDSLGL
jgi:hypothetical protein